MSFNPLAIVAKANTIKNRMMMQCMEKTVRILLLNIARYEILSTCCMPETGDGITDFFVVTVRTKTDHTQLRYHNIFRGSHK